MKKLRVHTPSHAYDIFFSAWDFKAAAQVIRRFLNEDRLFIITNATVKRLHGKTLQSTLQGVCDLSWIVIPDGEKHKTLKTAASIHEKLSRIGAHRKSLLLAFGGGVVGDIAGFVAATYMRGIDYIQMPTTLLAQVDSSVGGKTGVDLPTGKNLVGAFYQPRAVIIQTVFLNTLPRRELLCGMAEVIKYGLIRDPQLFDLLIRKHAEILGLEPSISARVIYRCCQIKAEIVGQDEREAGLRAILNFGHTYGHALEAVTGFGRILHGEAVAIGMVVAARLSHKLGASLRDLEPDVRRVLGLFGLPTDGPRVAASRILSALRKDKKSTKNKVTFIILRDIGSVKCVPVDPREILKCL